MIIDEFTPPFFLKNSLFQTFLNNVGIRKLGLNYIRKNAEETILETKDGVRLQLFTNSKNIKPKGIVILLHGWEGSVDSAYILTSCKYFLKNGYNVFRLNMRDHGDTHQLNEGFFLGTLLEELFDAIKLITEINPDIPHFIMGFSLGANFTLRVASKAGTHPIKNLKAVFAVNPPIDPLKTTIKIDNNDLVRKHFAKKWKKTLLKNENMYPHLYDFTKIYEAENCMEITELLVDEYSDYKNALDYFSGYALTKNVFSNIKIPATIITSVDDPVIPVEDFAAIKENDYIEVSIQKYGGHCGYIKNNLHKAWYIDVAREMFDSLV